MYKVTREEASTLLNMSTRSIDRYIKSWKLRAQKEWKIVYIHQDDIDNFLWNSPSKQEVITREDLIEPMSTSVSTNINNDSNNSQALNYIYEDLKSEIKSKDEEIKNLSIELWKMQEVVKSSISLIEFKKTQFLLEESKNWAITNLENTKKELLNKQAELNQEKKITYWLTIVSIVLFLLLIIIWIVKI